MTSKKITITLDIEASRKFWESEDTAKEVEEEMIDNLQDIIKNMLGAQEDPEDSNYDRDLVIVERFFNNEKSLTTINKYGREQAMNLLQVGYCIDQSIKDIDQSIKKHFTKFDIKVSDAENGK